MPNSLVAVKQSGWQTCGLVWAQLNTFCVQQPDNYRLAAGINRRLYIGPRITTQGTVGKAGYKTLMLSPVSHKLPPAFLGNITDVPRMLSTLSTPPITTTTKNIINSKEL